MNTIYKIIKKLCLYLSNDFIFTLKLLQTVLFDIKKNTAIFLNQKQLLGKIKGGKSVIRFGDGEIALILGESIHFQKYTKSLSERLKKIINEYNQNSDYIVCIAERYIQASNSELKAKNLFNCWIVSKAYFRYYRNKSVCYGDAHMFYINGYFEKCITPLLTNKDIIVVTKAHDIAAKRPVFEKVFLNTVEWIEAPERDSYQEIDSILQSVLRVTKERGNTVVLVSAGPMGKVLAYELVQKGIQTIDIGHGLTTLFENNQTLQKVLL